MYLLDTSAWLAHLFGEPGMAQVTALFDEPQTTVNISVLSIPEVFARLKSLGQEARWQKVWVTYAVLFSRVIPVDEAVAHQAIKLRTAASTRLPTVDGLIAATAVVGDLTLVHRDPHLAAIPTSHLHQVQLPDKH